MTSQVCGEANWACAPEGYVAELDEGLRHRAEVLAWTTLRALTAYQVGDCPITVRPCDPGCGSGATTWTEAVVTSDRMPGYVRPGEFSPRPVGGGQWINLGCNCAQACSCTYVPTVYLPGPVGRVDEVVVDGVILDSGSYRVDNGNELVRTDGGHWPKCQDMAADCGEPGSFCVTYVRGHAADEVACWMAGLLAYEFAKSCTGGPCRLPSSVTSVVRQGVTYEMGSEAFENGMTGIREVDAYTRALNPYRLKSPPMVYSPDRAPARMTTWSRGVYS